MCGWRVGLRFSACPPAGLVPGRRSPTMDRPRRDDVHCIATSAVRYANCPAARAPPGPCAVGRPSFVRSRRVRWAVCLRPGRPDVSPAAAHRPAHACSVSPATFFTVAVTGSTICAPISTRRHVPAVARLLAAAGIRVRVPLHLHCMHGHDRTSCTTRSRPVCVHIL